MTSTAAATTPTLPNTLKWATWLAFTYAAVVIINAIVFQALNSWDAVLIRTAGFVISGAGLLRRARWAWLLGLGLASLFLGVAGIDFALWLAFRTPWWDSMLMVAPVAAVAVCLLAALVVLLLHPQSRAAIRAAAV